MAQLQVNILSSGFHIPEHSTTNRKQHHLISWAPQSNSIILTVDFCTKFTTDYFTLYTMPTCNLTYTFCLNTLKFPPVFLVSETSFYTCLPFHVFSLKIPFTYTFKKRQSWALYQKYAHNRERMITSVKQGTANSTSTCTNLISFNYLALTNCHLL